MDSIVDSNVSNVYMIIFITIITMYASTYFSWEISLNGSGEGVKHVKRHRAKINLRGKGFIISPSPGMGKEKENTKKNLPHLGGLSIGCIRSGYEVIPVGQRAAEILTLIGKAY
jgi:hypothetical protein